MQRRTFFQTTAAAVVLQSFRSKLSWAKGPGAMTDDPLLSPWTGAHGGFPRFDKIKAKDIKPALVKGMDLNRTEIAAIAGAKDAATFENTIAALEDAGRPFGRVSSVFNIFTSTMNDKDMQAVQAEMAPILAAFGDEITQNEQLFARVKAVKQTPTKESSLTSEQERLVDVVYRSFARRGAALGAKDKTRLKDINQKLASLYTKFSQNELADEESFTMTLDSESDLAGLPD